MNRSILFLFLLFTVTSFAQKGNVLAERDFWKNAPSVKEIKIKIAEGNDPSASHSSGFDGVTWGLIESAPTESIQFMLQQKGNTVDKPTHGDLFYLHWAAYKGNLEIMETLLKMGADASISSSRGTGVLAMAGLGGVEDRKVYDLILAEGIDPKATNAAGANILHLLAGSAAKDASIFQYFIQKGVQLDAKDNNGNGLFNYAARGGNLDIMKMCIEKGLDYQSLNTKGENAVLFAAYGGRRTVTQLEIYEYMESLGLDFDVVSWEGKTPLHNAIRRADPKVIDFLIEQGVNINQIDEDGNTAFQKAIGANPEVIAHVLTHVKNINHQNHEGLSALTIAVQRGSKETFNLLLENGADAKQIDGDGNNLMYYAFNHFSDKRQDVTEYFLSTLSTHGLKPTSAYTNGNTLAHIAIEKESSFLLQKAIEMGINLNQLNEVGLNSLHLAAMKAKDDQLLSILIDNGADKHILTEHEENAYELATQNELLNKKDIDISFLKLDK